MNKRSQTVSAVILTLIMTFMEMSALPALLFCNIKIWDIEPIYFALMANFLIAFAICWIYRIYNIRRAITDEQALPAFSITR